MQEKGTKFTQKCKSNVSYYKILISKVKDKWNSVLNISIDDNSWKNIFHLKSVSVTCNTTLTRFQNRILNRIIGVRKYLVNVNKDNLSKCSLCFEAEESIENLFGYCCNTVMG